MQMSARIKQRGEGTEQDATAAERFDDVGNADNEKLWRGSDLARFMHYPCLPWSRLPCRELTLPLPASRRGLLTSNMKSTRRASTSNRNMIWMKLKEDMIRATRRGCRVHLKRIAVVCWTALRNPAQHPTFWLFYVACLSVHKTSYISIRQRRL